MNHDPLHQMAALEDAILRIIDMSAGKQIGKNAASLAEDENLFDLGMTSIGFISMIVELEQSFDVVFDEDELQLSLYNSVCAIRSKMAEKLGYGRQA